MRNRHETETTGGGPGQHQDTPAGPRAAAPPPTATTPQMGADRLLRAARGRVTGGLSTLALTAAVEDWTRHMAGEPARQMGLMLDSWNIMARAFSGSVAEKPETDRRFAHPGWQSLPLSAALAAYRALEEITLAASAPPRGVSGENARMVQFLIRQWLDMMAPSNLPFLNPEVVEKTLAEKGSNLLVGQLKLLGGIAGAAGTAAPVLEVGRDLAVTPGKVVFRNALFELIQYTPETPNVHAEPVLIVPAWIMKYYILDLSPESSLVQYLVWRGFTVFAMSWRNPDASMSGVGFDDYREHGLMPAITAALAISGAERLHAAGYCLGGTILSIGAAAMARDGDTRLASATLFCAQTDFTEAGELQTFVTEGQLALLEDVTAVQGYLGSRQMGGAFQMLRSRELIWSRLLNDYWLGNSEEPTELMLWNEDATRLPARMHSEYLRGLFLGNDLAAGRFLAGGRPVALSDIRMPLFVVGTETDHVAPWRSVFKLQLFSPADMTFVLTSGGHNAGIVSPPGHPRRHYRIAGRPAGGPALDADTWLAAHTPMDGSWWPAWADWLSERAGAADASPPAMGSAAYPVLGDAPGSYVMER